MKDKPLGKKLYGSIPHLPKSRVGIGDHSCSEGQAKIATEKLKNKDTIVIVQEKLDGSNVGACKINGIIYPLQRAGYLANTSPYYQHKLFYDWVMLPKNYKRFDLLLEEGERVCGEWLIQAVGTKYKLTHEPFVVFDIIKNDERVCYNEFKNRAEKFGFITPNTIHIGEPLSIDKAMELLQVSGHGALEEVEGAIWRVERKGKVEFLCKYVKHNKIDGKYFPENNDGNFIWNEMKDEPFPYKGWRKR